MGFNFLLGFNTHLSVEILVLNSMKNIFLFFIFILITKSSFSQSGENPLPFVYEEPKHDTAPQFPGGTTAMMKYFADSIQYPEPERSKGLEGGVYLKFIVSEEGKIIGVTPINGVPGAPNFVKESIRLMYAMPSWIPAKKNGKPVEAEYNLSVPFTLK